jgi:hypothetical protein
MLRGPKGEKHLVDVISMAQGNAIGGSPLRCRRHRFVLKFRILRLWSIAHASELDPVDCAERSRSDGLSRHQQLREIWHRIAETDVGEADLETTITGLMSGQYSDPVRVVAFNTAEHWSEDASEDVAREIMRRLDLAGHELPSSIAAFVDSHLGPDRQPTLRLA